jgi:3'-phosphoadenosine 5'-phosphosulfate sulfotransferase (PAPS reductase)/FAD synthetase
MTVFHVVSVSGGKDSDATLVLALQRFPKDRVLPIYCDTGNEHEAVDEHLAYLEARLGIKITRLRASFAGEIERKRMFVARDQRTRRQYKVVPRLDANGDPIYRKTNAGEIELRMVWKGGQMDLEGIPRMRKAGGRKVRWSNKAKRRAMAAMHPSGNPFLDLCIWKGRFPSRKAQFCTQELKTTLAVEFQMALVEAGHRVVSWQGVRRDESQNRRNAKVFERLNPRMYAHRPLATWTAMEVFAFLAAHDIEPNRLYREGMSRVGCMPCINQDKPGIREMAARWPEHAERISAWERIVGDCSKRGISTFMTDAHAAHDRRQVFAVLNIWARIKWSKTTRGGKQLDLLGNDEAPACASAYGLCE